MPHMSFLIEAALDAGKNISRNNLLRGANLRRQVVEPIFGNVLQGERECLKLDMFFRNPLRCHGCTNNMEFLQMFMRIFTCKTMKSRQQMDQTSLSTNGTSTLGY